jgi:hypothetical protein
MTHKPEARYEVEPIAEFRYELARKQVAEVAVPADKLTIGERLHLLRIAE